MMTNPTAARTSPESATITPPGSRPGARSGGYPGGHRAVGVVVSEAVPGRAERRPSGRVGLLRRLGAEARVDGAGP